MNLFELAAVLTLDKSGFDQGVSEAEGQGQKLGASLGQKLASGAKVAGGVIVGMGTATAALTKGFLSAAGTTAAYGDNIDKMSQKMGLSAQKYQEWDFILQHSGSSIEAMKGGMRTLANAVEQGSDAFEQLGITQEEIANMSQEQLFERTISELQKVESTTQRTYLAGKLLGRGATELGALLNTSAEDTEAMRKQVHLLGGVMSDEAVKAAAAYQDSLQNMQVSISGLKNNIISDFLPSVTTMMDGLASIFSGNSEEGIGLLNQGVQDFVTQLSEATAEILPIAAEILTTLASAIIENLPVLLDSATSVILTLVEGIIENLPTLFEVAIQILQSLIQGITENLPTLIPAAMDAVLTVVQGLYDNLPALIGAGLDMIIALAQGLINAIPQLVAKLPQIINSMVNYFSKSVNKIAEAGVKLLNALVKSLPTIIQTIVAALPQIISSIVQFFTSAIPQLIQAGIDLLVSLVKALPTIIKTIVAALPQIIQAITKALTDNIPALVQAGFELFVALVQNLPAIIKTIIAAVPQIIAGIVETFGSFLSSMWNIGKSLAEGIWTGLKNAVGWIKEKIKGWVGDVFGFIKRLFGIASPSKLMRDQIGLMLGKGMAEGIEDSLGDVEKASEGLMGAIPDIDNRDFSLNVRRNISDSYSAGMNAVVGQIREIMGEFEQTIVLNLNDRELGRAVRGYV